MRKPTIHRNGTSKPALYEQLLAASAAVRAAIWALAEAAPNARDYYPQGPDAYPQASAQHSARVQKMVDVREELYSLLEHVADA